MTKPIQVIRDAFSKATSESLFHSKLKCLIEPRLEGRLRPRISSRAGRELMVFALVTGLFVSVTFSSAFAQASPVDKKLDEIEKQIQALKKVLDGLRPAQPASEPAATTNRPASTEPDRQSSSTDPIARIRDEGLNRSKVMETLSYLTDVIGPRLTGSPNLKRANEWTRDTLASWGLANAHLEAWGPFGRGWSLQRFSAQIVEPYNFPLIGYPKAWSPGFDPPLVAEVVYLDAKTDADLEKFKGKLKDAVVLASPPREVRARFDPLAIRITETNLLRMANSSGPQAPAAGRGRFGGNFGRRGGAGTNSTENASSPSGRGRRGGPASPQLTFQNRVLSFVAKEGAALVVSPSGQGDGGTLFIAAASVPSSTGSNTNASVTVRRATPWATNSPGIPSQLTLAVEDYNRLVRMLQQGAKLKMEVDLKVQFHEDDLMAYNTIAEIPGSDLQDEIVMLGAHMDSWHSGTGATDNGAGVAATMEAVRIFQTLKLQPRRTIRLGLWTGEEQGLLGSEAYVGRHFGYYTNITNAVLAQVSGGDSASSSTLEPAASASRPTRRLVRQPNYEKFSAYFNLDNGTGKIRGVYMQGNEAARPLFRRWLAPFADLGAETLTLNNTSGTDHLSFDEIGLPGFQFIQDPLEYNTRTHHSNADVFDRIQAEDMKQAATILAAFAYQAATMDEKFPRKSRE